MVFYAITASLGGRITAQYGERLPANVPVPVHLDGQGRVAFRDDIYRRDTRLAEALGIALHLPRPDDRRADADDVGP
jgi:hypothetical protein